MKKKVLVSAGALALAVGVTAAGTLAWLQDNTDTVTNTFTWSDGNNITLTLDETSGTKYTIIPGETQAKDPTLHLTTETESYVYVLINNELGDAVTMNELDQNWTKMENANLPEGMTGDLYYWTAGATTTNPDMSVFDTITYSSELDSESGAALNGKTITITGYAVQASAGTDAATAWAATFGAEAPVEP